MVIEVFGTRWGKLSAMANDRPIASALERYGEWAQIEIEFLSQFLPENGIIVDAGAHVGIHSLAFARLSGKAEIHSFEPQPQLADLLKRNTDSFRERITVHQCAIGAANDRAFIPLLADKLDVNAGAQRLESEPGAGRTDVSLRSLDSFELSPVSFIKLDVEGCESRALLGASQTIARDRPVIYCEVNSIASASDILRIMQGQGYNAYFVSTAAFNPQNFGSELSNFFGVAHESALLLLPDDRAAPLIGRSTACSLVHDLDEFAQLFMKVPRYGDETDYDHDARRLKVERNMLREKIASHHEIAPKEDVISRSRAERDATEAELRNTRIERAHREQMLALARTEIQTLRDDLKVERQRYHALAPLLWKSDLAARRRSLVGTIARLFGQSELARTCRILTESGLFDRKWYKKTYGDVASSEHEPVVHYLLFGAFEGRKPNQVFDSAYYLRENPDVRLSGMNPLLHYIHYGEGEGRRPSADFDPTSFRKDHPSLPASGGLLLRHFLDVGDTRAPVLPPFRPVAPEWSAFEALVGASGNAAEVEAPLVDVIIPVYRGYDDTLSCILSVLTSRNTTPFDLIVIDDASPEPELSGALDRLAEMGLITLLRNERNLGFVGTVNRGMAMHDTRDVLLLNSDTLVFNDWLDRIRAHGTMPDIATVTPFTNSGTICSYPEFCRDNPSQLEISFSDIDRIAAAMNHRQAVDVPTGVGFCMYITRKALDGMGLFDVETFGKGYGEENDFCVRASANGFRNLHALDVFVFHSGETSFGADASKAKKAGLNALTTKHPGYLAEVERYIAADPAKTARTMLDVGRLLKRSTGHVTLCFTHKLGGGIERYLRDRAASPDSALLLAVPSSPTGGSIRLSGIDGTLALPNMREFDLERDVEDFVEFLRSIRVDAIEVHSTVGWSTRLLQFVPLAAQLLGVPFDFMTHDYVPICPQINLINQSGLYCGEQGHDQCRRCLNHLAKSPRVIHPDVAFSSMADIAGWRAEYKRFLEQAREIAAPSFDTAKRLQHYFPAIDIEVRPHKEPLNANACHVALRYRDGPLQVAIIGAIGAHKGAEILERCAEDAEQRGLPIHFTVIGYTSIPDLGCRPNVTVTGSYAENEVYDRLKEAGAHIAFLPSVWPETYCYTLSIAMAAGLPVCVFDLGAPAERLREGQGGILMPIAMMQEAHAINDTLIETIEVLTADRITAGLATLSWPFIESPALAGKRRLVSIEPVGRRLDVVSKERLLQN